MICNACGADNPAEYRFCGNCASPLNPLPISDIPPTPSAFPNEQNSTIRKTNSRNLLVGLFAAGCLGITLLLCAIVGIVIVLPGMSSASAAQKPTPTVEAFAKLAEETFPTLVSKPAAPETAGTPLPKGEPTSAVKKWTASQVLNAFKSAGLEIGNPRPMTSEEFGAAPQTAAEAYRFFIASLGGTKGGKVFTFNSNADLKALKSFFESDKSGLGAHPIIFVKDNVLVQINGELAPDRAKRYESALLALK